MFTFADKMACLMGNLSRRISVLWALCACAFTLAAQNLWSEQYYVNLLNITNGLLHNNVKDLFFDSRGFMWVSTYGGGAVRYDGYSFEPLMPGRTNDMNSNSCLGFAEDPNHRLWIAYDEGTVVVDLMTMRSVIPTDKNGNMERMLHKPSVRVYCDSKGGIWHVMTDSIWRYTFDETGAVTQMAGYRYRGNTPDVSICDIERNGTVWCNIDNGLFRLSEADSQLVRRDISPVMEQLKGYYVTDMLKQGNSIWISTNHGLFSYNLFTNALGSFRHTADNRSLSHDYVTSLAVNQNGSLLVGTLRGLDIMDIDTGYFEHWNSSSGSTPLPSDFVHCVLVHNGQIWIGTETAGVVTLSPRPFLIRSYVHDNNNPGSLSANPVNAMYVAPHGTLWVGTVEGGLNCRNAQGDFTHWTTRNSALSHNSVSVLEPDDSGRLWIGTWGGGLNVVSLDGKNTLRSITQNGRMAEQVSHIGSLAYDKRNQLLWIGANEGIFLYNLRNGQVEIPFQGHDEIRGCIGSHIDKDGQLWMGCITGACVVDLKSGRDGKGQFKYRRLRNKLDQPTSAVIDKISCFCETRDGTLWLGSSSYGLYRREVDAKSGKEYFLSLTVSDGLANNAVKGIVEDVQERLWITTNNGLSIYDTRTRTFTNYSNLHGLPYDQFYWNSAVRGPDGAIYLGTVGGLVEVRGENTDNAQDTRLTFTRLLVNNQVVTADQEDVIDADIAHASSIRLHESDKSFTIEFSPLTYSGYVRGYYSYRMKGFERDWTVLHPGEHSVRYTSLHPGEYTFEVMFTPQGGVEESQVKAIQVVVKPYFWKSWWFFLLMMVALAVVLWWLQRTKLEAWKRREAEKLLEPIRKVLEESDTPERLQTSIRNILDNHKLVSHSLHRSVEADKENAMKNNKPFMEQATEILEKNYMNNAFGITEFADAIGMSKSLLSKRLNAEAGQSTGQFIRNYRLNIAKRMILENPANLNITEIAYRVGFNDPKYFTRCFTNLYGCSPKMCKE